MAARSKLCHSEVDRDVSALRGRERAVGHDSGRGEEGERVIECWQGDVVEKKFVF
jgi:hypothetical protein